METRPPGGNPHLLLDDVRSPHWQSQKLSLLHEIDIFQDLTHQELEWVKASTRMVLLPTGQVIYDQGEPAEVLFILKRGKVELYRLTSAGKKLAVDTIYPGTFFGEMPLVDLHMRETYAEAQEESLVCILEREELEQLILQKPRVALRLLEALSERLARQATRLEAFAYDSAPARIAAALLHLARGGIVSATHQDLAGTVGVYRETVSKVLADFQRQGLVDLGRKQITLKNATGLKALANSANGRGGSSP
jgi:CRP-like cAMP-binding protein